MRPDPTAARKTRGEGALVGYEAFDAAAASQRLGALPHAPASLGESTRPNARLGQLPQAVPSRRETATPNARLGQASPHAPTLGGERAPGGWHGFRGQEGVVGVERAWGGLEALTVLVRVLVVVGLSLGVFGLVFLGYITLPLIAPALLGAGYLGVQIGRKVLRGR